MANNVMMKTKMMTINKKLKKTGNGLFLLGGI